MYTNNFILSYIFGLSEHWSRLIAIISSAHAYLRFIMRLIGIYLQFGPYWYSTNGQVCKFSGRAFNAKIREELQNNTSRPWTTVALQYAWTSYRPIVDAWVSVVLIRWHHLHARLIKCCGHHLMESLMADICLFVSTILALFTQLRIARSHSRLIRFLYCSRVKVSIEFRVAGHCPWSNSLS